MNWYQLTKQRFNFRYENVSKCRSIHTELYFYIVNLWNKLGQKKEFWLPTQMTMEMLGVWSYNTYNAAYQDLVDWKFIKEIKKSKNQYSARIVALSKSDEASDDTHDKAMYEARDEATDIIIEQTNNIITNNKYIDDFEEVWKFYPKKSWKDRARKTYLKEKPDKDLVISKIKLYKSFVEQEKLKWFDRKHKDGWTWFYQKWWLDEYEVKTIMDKRKELQTKKRETHWTDEQDKYIKQLKDIKEQVLEETGRTDKEYVLQAQRSNFI